MLQTPHLSCTHGCLHEIACSCPHFCFPLPSPPPLPPPQGQTSLAQSLFGEGPHEAQAWGLFCALSTRSLQFGKTLTLIFFQFFLESVLQRDPLCLPDSALGGAPKSCQSGGQKGAHFHWLWPPYGTVFLNLFVCLFNIILLRSPFRHFFPLIVLSPMKFLFI